MGLAHNLRQDLSEWWRSFWHQPNKQYRNFHIVFALLGIHFLVPSFVYAFAPASAIGQLQMAGELLGAGPYKFAEAEGGYVWRVLAAGNVFTLAFMCFMIQLNVRRFYAVLVPLVALKSYASVGFLAAYLFGPGYPPMLGVAVWDFTNVLMFLYFAHRAYWGLEEWGEESAVPRLFFDNGRGQA